VERTIFEDTGRRTDVTKVVVGKLASSGRRGKPDTVTERRVTDAEGKTRTIRTLDIGSPSFSEDLQYVFERNVAKARRDNKRVAGVTDVAPTKR
jgi:hypothetical protein